MGIDPGGVVDEGNHTVGMRERDGERIEPCIIRLAPGCRRRHLQHDRLRRDLDRRHCDLVLVAEVLQRFDVGIARVEIEWIGGHRGDAHDPDIALGLRPQRRQRGRAERRELHRPGDQPVVHHAGASDLHPIDLEESDAGCLGMLLDEPVALHQHHRQEADAGLLRGGDLADLGARQRRHHRSGRQRCDRQRPNG